MEYGVKRDYPAIHVWHKLQHGGDGIEKTTTWSATLKEAREQFAKARGIPASAVGAAYKV